MLRNTPPPLASNDLLGVGDASDPLVKVFFQYGQRFVDDRD